MIEARFTGGNMDKFNFEQKLARLLAQKDRIAEMKRLSAQGISDKKIGEKFGLTRVRVHQILGKRNKREVVNKHD